DALFGRRRDAAVRVLVAEIPTPERGMTGESPCAFAREQGLRLEQERVHVPVAHRALDDPIASEHAKTPSPAPPQRPLGNEVRAAHVACKERWHDPEIVTSGR